MTSQIQDLSKLCIHTITTRPLAIEQAVDAYSRRGITGITVWRDALEGRDLAQVRRWIESAGMRPVSVCRGGFFPAVDPAARRAAIDDNLRAIDQAAELGAPLVVLVCGADPRQGLEVSRAQIEQGITAVLPYAQACGVRLGIEPLHPMYADTRSAVNTIEQANDICQRMDSPSLGVVVDIYHLWWDPHLEAEIRRCGENGWLAAFHICDWRSPTEDLLNDRGLMGEGCIPIRRIRGWVEATGFDGFNEVEIFSNRYWGMEQEVFLDRIVQAYLKAS